VLESSSPLEGVATFSLRGSDGKLLTNASVPASGAGSRLVVPVLKATETGLALINPGDGPVNVSLRLT